MSSTSPSWLHYHPLFLSQFLLSKEGVILLAQASHEASVGQMEEGAALRVFCGISMLFLAVSSQTAPDLGSHGGGRIRRRRAWTLFPCVTLGPYSVSSGPVSEEGLWMSSVSHSVQWHPLLQPLPEQCVDSYSFQGGKWSLVYREAKVCSQGLLFVRETNMHRQSTSLSSACLGASPEQNLSSSRVPRQPLPVIQGYEGRARACHTPSQKTPWHPSSWPSERAQPLSFHFQVNKTS